MERRTFLVAFNALPRHAVSKVVLGRWRLERTRLRIREYHEQNRAERLQWGQRYQHDTRSANGPSTRRSTLHSSMVLGGHSRRAFTPVKPSYTPFSSFNWSTQRTFHTPPSSSASSPALARAKAKAKTLAATTTPARKRRTNSNTEESTSNPNETEYQPQVAQKSGTPSQFPSCPSSFSWLLSDAFADTPTFEKSATDPFSSPSPAFSPSTSALPSSSNLTAVSEFVSRLRAQNENGNISYCCRGDPKGALRRNDRFDWRLRAPSQLKVPLRQFPKRVGPPTIDPNNQMMEQREYSKSVETYKQHFLPLISVEQAEEDEAFQTRLSKWPLDRLKKEGYCLTGLEAYWLRVDNFGRSVAAFMLGPGVPLPPHRFEKGTQVYISRVNPLEEVSMSGSVISNYKEDPTKIRIAFPTVSGGLDSGEWRLDVGKMDIVYGRMREAIEALSYEPREVQKDEARGFRLGFGDDENGTLEAINSRTQSWLIGTELRDVLLKSFGGKGNGDEGGEVLDELTRDYGPRASQDPEYASYPGHDGLDPHLSTRPENNATATAAESKGNDKGKDREPPLLKFEGAFKDDMRIQSWARRYSMENPLIIEGDPDMSNLNDSQRRAVAMMIGQRASLIQGPPGTGKTKTIIETVKLLKLHFQVPHPLLVSTFTNAAVDNLVEGLAEAGLKPLRVSTTGKVRDNLMKWSLEQQQEEHELNPQRVECLNMYEKNKSDIEDLEEEIEKMQTRLKEVTKGKETLENKRLKLEGMKKRAIWPLLKAYAIQQQMWKEILHDADVICTTCVTSANTALKMIDFPVVFLDEASMSMEPASLIPLMKGSRHVALIGDHKQLPPVVKCKKAQALRISLFERMAQEGEVPSIMLDTQYRMHPGISSFPSSEFYGSALRNGTVDSNGDVIVGFEPPVSRFLQLKDKLGSLTKRHGKLVGAGLRRSISVSNLDSETEVDISAAAAPTRPGYAGGGKSKTSQDRSSPLPIVFVDHHGPESKNGRSRENVLEAKIVISVVEDLLLHNPDLRGDDIGIISPYISQTGLLTRLLSPQSDRQERFRQVLGDGRAMQIPNIEIKTVDGFEGREKEVIIFSTVRNNSMGSIGFLDDRRRMNVGLTRAKRALIIVGSIYTLKGGKEDKKQADEVLGREKGRVLRNEQEQGQDDDESMGAYIPGSQAHYLDDHMSTGATTTAPEFTDPSDPTAWHTYALWLLDNKLVVRLEGDLLDAALWGNVDAAKRGRVAGSIPLDNR